MYVLYIVAAATGCLEVNTVPQPRPARPWGPFEILIVKDKNLDDIKTTASGMDELPQLHWQTV